MADRRAIGPRGPLLAAYLLASRAIPLLAGPVLRRRLARGKEDPARWREKLGEPSAARPDGRLVWLHAVGLGEVMALRGLIAQMAAGEPDLSFLVTSTARSSAKVMAANLPSRTVHQFLPLDAPRFLKRFLDHWRPDLSIWAEQELWPGAVVETHARGIPLALVNARITAESHARRQRGRGLYGDLLARFSLIAAQDDQTAGHLRALGAADVAVTGSLKSAAPPLAVDEAELDHLRRVLAGRRVWVAASTHAEDEAEVLGAQVRRPDDLLILAPRDVARAEDIAVALRASGLSYARRSLGEVPGAGVTVWLADSYGELGLWYRLADRALMGGSFGPVGGHNPWEPAALGAAILHGPNVTNFAADYQALAKAQAAVAVGPGGLCAALDRPDLRDAGRHATALVEAARGSLAPLASRLSALMRGRA